MPRTAVCRPETPSVWCLQQRAVVSCGFPSAPTSRVGREQPTGGNHGRGAGAGWHTVLAAVGSGRSDRRDAETLAPGAGRATRRAQRSRANRPRSRDGPRTCVLVGLREQQHRVRRPGSERHRRGHRISLRPRRDPRPECHPAPRATAPGQARVRGSRAGDCARARDAVHRWREHGRVPV